MTLPAAPRRRRYAVGAVGLAAAALAALRDVTSGGPKGFVVHPSQRRSALLGLASGTGFGFLQGEGKADAFYSREEDRLASYSMYAKQINEAADWYLFEIGPLVHPPQDVMDASDCNKDRMGCPENAFLGQVSEWYNPKESKSITMMDRGFFEPMVSMCASAIFDPDTSDDLRDLVTDFQLRQALLGKAARVRDLQVARQHYDDGIKSFNKLVKTVNRATELPKNDRNFLTPLPLNSDVYSGTSEDKYWHRRWEVYITKKKVDLTSKANKSARFYAKSIFGDDAVSWDERGDNAVYIPKE